MFTSLKASLSSAVMSEFYSDHVVSYLTEGRPYILAEDGGKELKEAF